MEFAGKLECGRQNLPGVDTPACFVTAVRTSGMSKATFELYVDREGKHRWRLVHDNGNIIADGGEGYTSRQNCKKGIESVKRNADGADVEIVDSPSTG